MNNNQALDWLNLLVAGVLVSGLIWLYQRNKLGRWIRGVLGIVLLALGAAWIYISQGPITLGEANWYDRSPWQELIVLVLMLAGMVARYLTQAIEARRQRIEELAKTGKRFTKPKLEFDVWEFSYPFLVSIITYGALIAQMNDARMSVAVVTLSFQFGFFWQTILGTKQKAFE